MKFDSETKKVQADKRKGLVRIFVVKITKLFSFLSTYLTITEQSLRNSFHMD
jgi:hypothetical protein